MKVLYIGGTGTISAQCVKQSLERGCEVYALNRGNRRDRLPEGARTITADINADPQSVRAALKGMSFDAVCQFIAFKPEQVERDIDLFSGSVGQYIFISSASAYDKPPSGGVIREDTPLRNPFWRYARDKIACESVLTRAYRENGFPATIARPSHTYSEWSIPVAVHGHKGSWQVLERMRRGRSVPLPGDGTTLWTFTHSRDFAGAFARLLGNPSAIGESVHITSDERLTWNQAYGVIARALGAELNALRLPSWLLDAKGKAYGYDFEGSLLGDKANNAVFDTSKIKRLAPGWSAGIRYDEGVDIALNHLKKHPELAVPDPDFDRYCDELEAVVKSLA
ncbi:MAG: SDR family oxidoreductase [Oscillospiraceae bacterium]|jgi:nucleoside-diphosphate-sugar epimerase|nr:SDR family oxidoreductase [Oscillospiraceae bacterium]